MPTVKRATLTDVARRAGVSVTTASYILNGRTEEMRISADTADRVRTAIDELGYRPNRTAQNLRGSRTQTLGFVSDFVASGAYSSRLITGVNAAARRGAHVALIGETMGNPHVERMLIEEMLDRGVDGVIYATLSASRIRLPSMLEHVRTVTLNCVDPRLDVPAVVPDDALAGELAAEQVAGVTGDVYVVGEDPTAGASAGRERMLGIERALRRVRRAIAGVVPTTWDVGPAYEAACAWLSTGVRPGSVICLNDRIAMGVYQALRDLGLDIPTDVSVVSFDGSDLAGWLRPRLTSMALPFNEMGARAVEILLDPDGSRVGTTLMPPTVMSGDSVAC